MTFSSQSSYILPIDFNPTTGAVDSPWTFTALLTTGDTAGVKDNFLPWRMAGIPDGLGAFDNGDGTFSVLMNHELGPAAGVPRDHGSPGAFVSLLTIDKTTLEVLNGRDLVDNVHLFDTATSTYTNTTTAFARLCSADLPAVTAFYNPVSGLGYNGGRVFMNGEETGAEGRAFAHFATGTFAGNSYELPALGKFSWENSVANPSTGDKTVVVGTDDATPGQVYVYYGDKKSTGTPLDQAGLTGGSLWGFKVADFASNSFNEPNVANPLGPDEVSSFSLVNLGDVTNKTGATLQTDSVAAGVTAFLRPEDAQWDTINPNRLYFVTTNGFNQPSRLWAMDFVDAKDPTKGGTARLLLNGTEGQQMMDNITVDARGHVIIQEDPGNNEYLAKVLDYDPVTDTLVQIGTHDPARFLTGAPGLLTRDEESSGVIDVSSIFGVAGQAAYLLDVQAHYPIPGELVEGGQLILARLNTTTPPSSFAPTGTAGADFLVASPFSETINGLDSNDTIQGGGGADTIDAGPGDDIVYGDLAIDTPPNSAIPIGGNDVIAGGTGGSNQLFGGAGSDTVSYAASTGVVFVDLNGQVGTVDGVLTDSLNSIENATGGSGNDLLIGTAGVNTLNGGAGADELQGMDGDDVLIGGTAPGGQYNQLFGGNGSDTASYAGTAASVTASIEGTGAYVSGALVDAYNSIENLIGGSGTDVLVGDGGANRITGGAGADQLYGRGGSDTFAFQFASDSRLSTGYDTIADFTTGSDKIDLSAFGIDASRVMIASDGGSTVLMADTDSTTSGFELAVSFIGANALVTGDLIF